MNTMRRFPTYWGPFAAIIATTIACNSWASPVAQIPVPHRAIYKIDLQESQESSGVTSAEGRMVFEIAGNACEGYTMSQRLVVLMGNRDDADQLLDFRVSTFESGDGGLYRFASRTYLDEVIVEQATGTAERKSGAVQVALDSPGKKSLTFDQSVLFPSQHLQALLKAARADQRFFSTSIYEGAGQGERADVVTAIIGSAEQTENREGLIEGKMAWPISIAYFNGRGGEADRSGEEVPDYQMSFTLFENGVARKLRMNYGDYTLSGELQELDALETSECQPG